MARKASKKTITRTGRSGGGRVPRSRSAKDLRTRRRTKRRASGGTGPVTGKTSPAPGFRPALVAHVEVSVALKVPIARAWEALCHELSAWWPKDFHALPDGTRIELEPRAGGTLMEFGSGGSSLLWATVTQVSPPNTIMFQSTIAPPWGGPAVALIRMGLEPDGEAACVLKLSDNIFGALDENLTVALEGGWRHLFTTGLKAHVEQTRAG